MTKEELFDSGSKLMEEGAFIQGLKRVEESAAMGYDPAKRLLADYVLIENKDADKALEYYKSIENPTDEDDYNMGKIYYDRKDYEKAEEKLLRALRSDNVQACLLLKHIYIIRKDLEKVKYYNEKHKMLKIASMSTLELFSLAKNIAEGEEPYNRPKCAIIRDNDPSYVTVDFIRTPSRPIEIVETERFETYLSEGFLAGDRNVRMLIVNCENVDSNVLDESIVQGIIFKGKTRNIYNNILLQQVRYIYVTADNPYYCSENSVLFTKDKKVLVAYAAKKEKEEYVVGPEVEEISNFAFHIAKLKRLYLSRKAKVNLQFFDESIEIHYID